MSSESYHEPMDRLSEAVIDRHRAISTIMEELEAVDWYDQRISATGDQSLARVLAHHRDEEKEHAAMAIEWLRRNDATFDEQLRAYLFTEEEITEVEAIAEGREPDGQPEAAGSGDELSVTTEPAVAAEPNDGGLGIGSLRAVPHEEDLP